MTTEMKRGMTACARYWASPRSRLAHLLHLARRPLHVVRRLRDTDSLLLKCGLQICHRENKPLVLCSSTTTRGKTRLALERHHAKDVGEDAM